MPSAEDITNAVNSYLETVSQGRPDDIVALYAEDATIEDPVGSDLHIGHEAIRGFYQAVAGADAKTEMVTLRALGNEAAYLWRLMIGGMTIEIISVMTFNDDAKIASMKAYWGPDNITQG
jgi:steroid delta-isomerase